MIIGSDKVVDYIKLTDAKHIRIYQGNNKRIPVYAYEGPGGNIACINAFQSWAALNGTTQAVEYYITLYPKGKPTGAARNEEIGETGGTQKDTLVSQFYLVSPAGYQAIPPAANMQQVGYIGAYPGQTNEQIIAKIREDIEKEYELEDMQEEIDTLKASQTAFYQNLNKITELIAPALMGFIPKAPAAVPRAPYLAGTDTAEPVRTKILDQDAQRISRVISRLRAADPQIIAHLEKLADIAETRPETFNGLINMLGNF